MSIESLILIGLMVGLVALRQPVMVLLGVAALFCYMAWNDGNPLYLVYDLYEAVNQETLLAIPLFILAGAIMSKGTIAARLIELAVSLSRPIPGGLAVATVLSCAGFAAITGSAAVTLLAVGSIMYRALIENGYSKSFAIGALCSGGVLGIIIPPSIPLILYGVMTETSITDLFKAGLGPAAVLVAILALYALVTNFSKRGGDWNVKEIATAFRRSVFALLVPITILGGIYGGIFTATEAAAVAVAVALVIELFIHREMKLPDVGGVVMETSKLLGSLFPVLAFAVSLNIFLTYEQMPQAIVGLMENHVDSQLQFWVLTNIFMLLVGMLIDIGSAVLILSPLLLPAAEAQGIDAVHLGIVMIVNLGIGYLTPPLGLNLIVAMAAFKESFWTVCKAVMPFILLMIVGLAIIVAFPSISLMFVKGG
jgi:C4-dicarboxylate transporter, DctM subunit